MTAAMCHRTDWRKRFWRSSTTSGPPATRPRKWRAIGGTVVFLYRDNLVKIVVDVPDTAENRRWLQSFKARWKTRLEQLELLVVSYPIDAE
jgi:hypothetical protein